MNDDEGDAFLRNCVLPIQGGTEENIQYNEIISNNVDTVNFDTSLTGIPSIFEDNFIEEVEIIDDDEGYVDLISTLSQEPSLNGTPAGGNTIRTGSSLSSEIVVNDTGSSGDEGKLN